MHFWLGSLCLVQDYSNTSFPSKVVAVSDIITILKDLGNKIPDKSWTLYLLELFNTENIPLELNLTCSFNDNGKFHAIFSGTNQYEFKNIVPEVGHSFLRQIIMNPSDRSITYLLQDLNTNSSEGFNLQLGMKEFVFESGNHFTGVEWWNKVHDQPYPIRFGVEVSHLLFGTRDDPHDPESITYFPYNKMVPNSDGKAKQYPVIFYDVKEKDSCLSYKIDSGISMKGIDHSFKKEHYNQN